MRFRSAAAILLNITLLAPFNNALGNNITQETYNLPNSWHSSIGHTDKVVASGPMNFLSSIGAEVKMGGIYTMSLDGPMTELKPQQSFFTFSVPIHLLELVYAKPFIGFTNQKNVDTSKDKASNGNNYEFFGGISCGLDLFLKLDANLSFFNRKDRELPSDLPKDGKDAEKKSNAYSFGLQIAYPIDVAMLEISPFVKVTSFHNDDTGAAAELWSKLKKTSAQKSEVEETVEKYNEKLWNSIKNDNRVTTGGVGIMLAGQFDNLELQAHVRKAWVWEKNPKVIPSINGYIDEPLLLPWQQGYVAAGVNLTLSSDTFYAGIGGKVYWVSGNPIDAKAEGNKEKVEATNTMQGSWEAKIGWTF